MKTLLLASVTALFLTTGTAHAGDLYDNPLETWKCGKVVIKINKYTDTDYKWEFVGKLPKRRLELEFEEHKIIGLNNDACEEIKKKGD
jgi:hypothetical protein